MYINRKIKISVILPVFNAEKYLKEAIESILNQTYSDFELIILNDGSTDKSVNIINSFNDKRIVKINQKNIGLPSTLNKGISIAKGEYIARMDADDKSILNRFEIQIAFMERHREVDVLGGAINFIDLNGKYLGRSFTLINNSLIRYYMFNIANVIAHPSVLIRKSAFEKYGIYNHQLNINEDYHLWCKFLRNGAVIKNVSDTLLDYRIHDDSISSNNHFNRLNSELWNRILQEDVPSYALIKELEKTNMQIEEVKRNNNFNNLQNKSHTIFSKILGSKKSEKIVTKMKNRYLYLKFYIKFFNLNYNPK